jgi:hypothetical protein
MAAEPIVLPNTQRATSSGSTRLTPFEISAPRANKREVGLIAEAAFERIEREQANTATKTAAD